jgi:sulfatase modifying factor 1
MASRGTGAGDCLSGICNSSNSCAPRCEGLAATCGPSGNGDCCARLPVPGGTFYRSYDGIDNTNRNYPATVSDFYLDKYEITVGRFRQFVEAGKGTQLSPPAAGDGKHPSIDGSGWSSEWNTKLAPSTGVLMESRLCSGEHPNTWTNTVGANESKPINCLDWYTAFAFCAWDGGRLPTEAEWNYAASGGDEQRLYPWTGTVIDSSYAVYDVDSAQNVGSKSPKGDGKWGHSDLAGNVSEWNLDWYATYTNPCINCAVLTVAYGRGLRGGSFILSQGVPSAKRSAYNPGLLSEDNGVRCARSGL